MTRRQECSVMMLLCCIMGKLCDSEVAAIGFYGMGFIHAVEGAVLLWKGRNA